MEYSKDIISARSSKRFRTEIVVRLSVWGEPDYDEDVNPEENENYGVIRNISESGALIQSEIPIFIGEEPSFKFVLPEQNVPVELNGEVRWSTEREESFLIGIEFDGTRKSERQKIENYLPDTSEIHFKDQTTMPEFRGFKDRLIHHYEFTSDQEQVIEDLHPDELYSRLESIGLDKMKVAENLAVYLNVDYRATINRNKIKLEPFTKAFCRENSLVPINVLPDQRAFALSNPFSNEPRLTLCKYFNPELQQIFITEPSNIERALTEDQSQRKEDDDEKMRTVEGAYVLEYDPETESGEGERIDSVQLREEFSKTHEMSEEELQDDASQEFIIDLVNKLFKYAVQNRVSDIHLEPRQENVTARFRIDGVLHEQWTLSKSLSNQMVSRIKILSDLDIAERRQPQDGGFQIFYKDRRIDFRVSIIPVRHGEKAVMRILDKANAPLKMTKLGFEKQSYQILQDRIKSPKGIIYFTGPTGSGKTTTMYTCLKTLNTPEVNIQTIEEPVEYNLPGINQMEINPDAGLTFPKAIRSVLRQDPDMLMVGEIRDRKTLKIALQAATSGHLVFTTLHTNSAVSTVDRLQAIEDDYFQLSATMELIVGQRLLRELCQECKIPVENPEEEYHQEILSHFPEDPEIFTKKGCEKCSGTGFHGRKGVMEALPGVRPVKEGIRSGKSPEELESVMKYDLGLNTMRENALLKVLRGETSVEEVMRVLGSPSEI